MAVKENTKLKQSIPEVWAAPIRTAIGEIRQMLIPARVIEVLDIEETQVSKRRTESLYVLATGERYVITERKTCPIPVGVDGVLLRSGDTLQWLHNAERDRHVIRIKGKGLAGAEARDHESLARGNSFQSGSCR